jgi:hypothetical protein
MSRLSVSQLSTNLHQKVFIDYGEEWEKAWEGHIQSWEAPSAENHGSVKQMIDNVVDLKTPEELEDDPYPENIRLSCQFVVDEEHEDEEEEYLDEEYWITHDDTFMQYRDGGEHWPCEVIDRIKGGSEGIYSVEIFQSPSRDETKWTELGMRRIVEQFPRESISFRLQSRSSDHYLPGVFRQPLGLPKEMLIESWMS